SFLVKTDMRPARKSPTGQHVLSGQHGSRKAPVRVEVQGPMQILAAGAGNAIDIEIPSQMEAADALVGVEPHHGPAQARQFIDLLIRAQLHIVEASILASPVVAKAGVRGESSCAEEPLARQRAADEVALAVEGGLAPAWNASNLNVRFERHHPR